TVSGVSDLKRILATADHFRIPAIVAINKVDLSPARSDEITAFCLERNITIAGRIPYDSVVPESMVQGHPVTEHSDGHVTHALHELWSQTRCQLFSGSVTSS
ncbi:MAG: (4Fe-4S)-binding protein, partial [Candidatus Eisenbacteria sp.]|nr:(4Fe-4S)-binding protein [Candidatus Eisenbacteria bacterium]